jgi:hypothetical protein
MAWKMARLGTAITAVRFLSALLAVRRRALFGISRARPCRTGLRRARGSPLGAAKPSSHVTVQRYHFRPALQVVEIVGPLLHHAPTLGKMRCPVVGTPVRIAHGMG